jgi:nitroreductase
MDTHEALLTRRTIHYWQASPIPNEVVLRALAAAHMAPCHRYTWPWRFIRVGLTTRAAIFELAVELKQGDKSEISERMHAALIRKVRNPGELIVVTLVQCEDDFMARENYAAASCAIQNIALSLHADGYGSKWSTGRLTRHEKTYQLLNTSPDQEEIIGFIWAGVPEVIPAPPERSLLEEHIRYIE